MNWLRIHMLLADADAIYYHASAATMLLPMLPPFDAVSGVERADAAAFRCFDADALPLLMLLMIFAISRQLRGEPLMLADMFSSLMRLRRQHIPPPSEPACLIFTPQRHVHRHHRLTPS